MARQSLIPDREILEAALAGLQSELNRIDTAMSDLRARLGQRGRGRPAASADAAPTGGRRGRRRMSAAARKRIGEATRRRWAARREAQGGQTEAPKSKPKRKMSKEGRAAIIAAAKKRWAAFRKGQAAPQATSKKSGGKGRKSSSKSRAARAMAATPPAGVPAPAVS